jgi:hypothetical protein
MTRRLGLCTAITALVAAALTAAAPSASAADPTYQAPLVGSCFDMSAEELEAPSNIDTPVDCAAAHTSTIIAVVQLPDDLTYDSTGLETFALQSCFPAQRQALGASKLATRLTAYNVGYFGPTAEQQAAGARWLRCDLVLGGTTDLQPLPSKLKVGKYPFSKEVSRCLVGRDFRLTACSQKHTYRATAAIKTAGKKFPNEKAWKRIGTQRCRSAVTSRSFRFGWPSKAAWKAGDRALICYSKTRR